MGSLPVLSTSPTIQKHACQGNRWHHFVHVYECECYSIWLFVIVYQSCDKLAICPVAAGIDSSTPMTLCRINRDRYWRIDGWMVSKQGSKCPSPTFICIHLGVKYGVKLPNLKFWTPYRICIKWLSHFFLTCHKTVQQLRDIIKWLFSWVSLGEVGCLYSDRQPVHEAVAVCTCSWIGDLHDCHWYLTVSTLVLVTDWTSVWLQLHLHSLHWWSVTRSRSL